jgi:hypothetical protein
MAMQVSGDWRCVKGVLRLNCCGYLLSGLQQGTVAKASQSM